MNPTFTTIDDIKNVLYLAENKYILIYFTQQIQYFFKSFREKEKKKRQLKLASLSTLPTKNWVIFTEI